MTATSDSQLQPLLKPALPARAGDKIQWGNLHGCAPALAISRAALAMPKMGLLIVPSTAAADQMERDLKLFLAGIASAPEVLRFSDWETLPYDSFSPHQDIVSERMRALYQLCRGGKILLIVAAATLAQKIPPQAYIIANSLLLKKGDTLDANHLRVQLSAAGYQAVDTVFQHGEYAVRGALLDIFPMGSEQAYRIELLDDEIESLREYVLAAQDSPIVETFYRQEDGAWLIAATQSNEDSVQFRSIDVTLAVREIYRDVTFPKPTPPSEEEKPAKD